MGKKGSMPKRGLHTRLRIVRSAMRQDLLQFAIPAFTVFVIEIRFCAQDGLGNFWGALWFLIRHPGEFLLLPPHARVGLVVTVIGFVFLLLGQVTLGLNHASTVLIREGHKLIMHGVYRLTRNPMYLGLILVVVGLPVYVASWRGFWTSLVLIPLILNRIRLEERLLGEHFGQAYLAYKTRTKRLVPFVF